jgi:uncharacterized protein
VAPIDLLLFFALGLVLGWLGGLFGIGGGLIAISILGLAFGLNQQQAQGTSLVMVVPTVLIGVYQYWRRGGMDWRIVTTMAVTAGLSTYLFARVAVALPSTPLRRGFAIFLLVLAVYYAWRAYADARSTSKPMVLPWPWTSVVGLLGGAISGFFTVGGAIFATPALTLAFGVPQTVAQGTGLALVIPGLIVGLAVYGAAGDVHWPIGLALAAGSISTVSLGVAHAHRLPESALKLCFSALLAATAVLLWLRA